MITTKDDWLGNSEPQPQPRPKTHQSYKWSSPPKKLSFVRMSHSYGRIFIWVAKENTEKSSLASEKQLKIPIISTSSLRIKHCLPIAKIDMETSEMHIDEQRWRVRGKEPLPLKICRSKTDQIADKFNPTCKKLLNFFLHILRKKIVLLSF